MFTAASRGARAGSSVNIRTVVEKGYWLHLRKPQEQVCSPSPPSAGHSRCELPGTPGCSPFTHEFPYVPYSRHFASCCFRGRRESFPKVSSVVPAFPKKVESKTLGASRREILTAHQRSGSRSKNRAQLKKVEASLLTTLLTAVLLCTGRAERCLITRTANDTMRRILYLHASGLGADAN